MSKELIYLPKITDEIMDLIGDKEDGLIEYIDGKPQWTQLAVDFVACLPSYEVNNND